MRLRDDAADPGKYRRTQIWRDQHGRPWEVTLNTETLTLCVAPIPRFRAPILPPLEYVKADPERLGRVTIDYDAWETEWAAAEEQFDARRLAVATSQYGAAAVSAMDDDLPELRRLVGVMPQSAEFVRAARAGNRWVLGRSRDDGSAYPVPPFAEGLLDRMGPRPASRDDLARGAADRSRYADVDETGGVLPATAPRAAARPTRAARPATPGYLTPTVAEGYGAATDFGDPSAPVDDAEFDEIAALGEYDDAAEDFDGDDGELADDGIGSDEGAVPASAVMVRTRTPRRGSARA